MDSPQIVGIGGFPNEVMREYVFGLARGRKVLFVGTASMEDPSFAVSMYESLRPHGEVSFLRFNPWPPEDLRGFALSHDVIFVGGGNTANMLAVWRVHGFDRILREAWESGIVLTGWSAGMICWFEAAVTDSFGPQLEGMRDGLAFLPGSGCPHYDGEERRRPVYRRGSRSTTRRPRASSASSCARSSPRRPTRAATESGPAARSRSRRGSCEALAAPPRPELREPGDRPQPHPDRRQQHVEGEVGDEQDRPPERPAAERYGPLLLHACAASALRSSTTRSTRCAVSSIESSEMSITGQPSLRWSFVACSSSS